MSPSGLTSSRGNARTRLARSVAVACVASVLAACAGSAGSTTTTDAATTVPSTTTTPTSTSTTAGLPSTTSPSEAVSIDMSLTSPTPPWFSMAVDSALIHASGPVTDGATVVLTVTTPGGDDVTFEQPATVEGGWFEGDVTLVPGDNVVTASATAADGASGATIGLPIRYVPDATVEFAFLTAVSESEIAADYAQWLTGDEANQAAFEDGVIASVDEGVPNDYYIRNQNPQLRTLPVASDVAVWLMSADTGPVAPIRVSPGQWLSLFDDGVPWPAGGAPAGTDPTFFGAGDEGASYWLTIVDGTVVAVEQQYRP